LGRYHDPHLEGGAMKKNDFFNSLQDILELSNMGINEETNLKQFEQYDSLSVLGIIALIDEKFNKKLSAENFKAVTTVKSLMQMIGEDKFE
jgi:acyl carrier protein